MAAKILKNDEQLEANSIQLLSFTNLIKKKRGYRTLVEDYYIRSKY